VAKIVPSTRSTYSVVHRKLDLICYLAALLLLFRSTVSEAEQVSLFCNVGIQKATTYSPPISAALEKLTATRHYVIDDTTKSLSIVLNDVPHSVCEGMEKCELKFDQSVVTVTEEFLDGYSSTTINRLSGELREVDRSNTDDPRFLTVEEILGSCKRASSD
jgi:hypothetical protein